MSAELPVTRSELAKQEDDGKFWVMGVGLCYATVCTSLPDEVAGWLLNLRWPTGIASPWKPSSAPFKDGTPNPAPCETDPTRRHVLFEC